MGRIPAQVPGTGGPGLRRRELATLLRTHRTDAGMTIEDVAKALLCSPSKVSRMETGERAASQRDIRDLSPLYQLTESQRDHLTALVKEQKEPAWWRPYHLPFTLATFVGLEADATRMSDYDPGVAPGLLQVPAYARAVHERTFPRLSDEEIDQRIEVLRNRQAVLTRADPAPPQYRAVIDEAALRRIVGGPSVMTTQLQHLIHISELPNVAVQILPFEAGAHPALDSTFILLDFDERVPSGVYVEGLVGQLYLERSQDVERYEQIFDRLRSMSLSAKKSANLMKELAATYMANSNKPPKHPIDP